MDQILSAGEVDALLTAMQDGELELEEPEVSFGSFDEEQPILAAQRFDLTNKERAYRGNLPGFEIINDRFASKLRGTLTRLLRMACDVQLMSTETIRFEEFVMQAARPTCVHLFSLAPLPGLMGVSMDASLVFGLVDALCGSGEVKPLSGSAVKILNRDFTAIELRVIKRLAHLMAVDLTMAFSGITKVKSEYIRTETRPELTGIALDSESVLHSVFELVIGKHKRLLGSVVPLSMLDPIKPKLLQIARADTLESKEAGELLKQHLLSTEVTLMVEFGSTQVDLRRLLNFNEGDIIRLNTRANGPLRIMVEGVLKYSGYPTTVNGQIGIEIDE